jgi:hypothetical protein
VRNEIDRLGRGVDRVACLTAPKQETSRAGDRDASWIETLAAPSESEVALARAWRGAFFFRFRLALALCIACCSGGFHNPHTTHTRAPVLLFARRARASLVVLCSSLHTPSSEAPILFPLWIS